ncbi:hypothetical protein N657DRAFT_88982 [Parathielavia appendiculata]|uniref:Uncharacterized protein n=1 Tax=Parathielavia appendiculata TaxID=2587402 RepID=A0AAN6UAW0_9PEZI|nr:hypothetical protein N657DRAFT_88982 [Parathielavia appendiculata]
MLGASGRKGMRLKSVWFVRRSGRVGGERWTELRRCRCLVAKTFCFAVLGSSSHHLTSVPHANDIGSALCFRRAGQPLIASFNCPAHLHRCSGSSFLTTTKFENCRSDPPAVLCSDLITSCCISCVSRAFCRIVAGPARRREYLDNPLTGAVLPMLF